MAVFLRRRSTIIKWFTMFVCLWVGGSVYMITDLEFPGTSFFGGHSRLEGARVRELMQPREPANQITDPLADLALPENLLSFYHLPRRVADRLYTEVTSANRDTSYPLAPDFSFHIGYGEREVVFYEDYGPGCVYRIYLYPLLPRAANELHKMSSSDLAGMFLKLDVDNTEMRFPLPNLMDGNEWPFIAPINTHHPKPSSGMGSYIPICYQENLKLSYVHNEKLPENIFQITVNCSKNDLLCPTHIYSAVSRHKFSKDVRVPSFAANAKKSDTHEHRRLLSRAVNLLLNPEHNGPSKGEKCELTCVEMCADCRKTIYLRDQPGVINSINLRVFESVSGDMLTDWSSILLRARFDSSVEPQIDSVPLGSMFGASGSLNDFRGAAVGHRKKYCAYKNAFMDIPEMSATGYFYFPMPFWRNAKLTLIGTEFVRTSLLVCYQINTVANSYLEKDTGYFLVKNTYYDTDVTRYREVLSVDSSWGHLVGLLMEVNHLRPIRNVPINHMWAGLQADAVVFLDGQKSASVLGTGLEDYFSYAHGFAHAENTTYAFVGNHHAEPRQAELLTWHCYRLHVLDPIVFHASMQFIMEGTLGDAFQTPAPALTHAEYMERRTRAEGTYGYTAMYYSRAQSGMTLTDELNVGDVMSETEHAFSVVRSGRRQELHAAFRLRDKRFIGACNADERHDKVGRQFGEDDKIVFKLRVLDPNQGAVLRREFHAEIGAWNERAYVWVNGVYLGTWFIPMGPLSGEYSLRQEDLLIGADIIRGRPEMEVAIAPQNTWRDISYQSLSIHVSS